MANAGKNETVVSWRCSVTKVYWIISWKSQDNFAALPKNTSSEGVSLWVCAKFFNIFSYSAEHLWLAASELLLIFDEVFNIQELQSRKTFFEKSKEIKKEWTVPEKCTKYPPNRSSLQIEQFSKLLTTSTTILIIFWNFLMF